MTHRHGLDIPGAKHLKSDMRLVKQCKSEMVKTVNGFQDLFEKFNVELIRGEARFISPEVIRISDGRLLSANNLVICTGSRAMIDASIPGLMEASPMTHVEILDLDTLPSHLIIIGGGYVGLEFAQAYRRFGSQVTVVQRGSQVLPREDKDVVDCLSSILEDEGIRLLTKTTVKSVEGTNGSGVTLNVDSPNAKVVLTGSHILVAAGRLPNVEDLDLAKAGIGLTRAGHISVNDQLQTAVPHIFAAGDCAGSPYFNLPTWAGTIIASFWLTSLAHPEQKAHQAVRFPAYYSRLQNWLMSGSIKRKPTLRESSIGSSKRPWARRFYAPIRWTQSQRLVSRKPFWPRTVMKLLDSLHLRQTLESCFPSFRWRWRMALATKLFEI